MTTRLAADLCILGAGSAGLSLAAGAAQLGRKVVLIEKGEMGGDCLNRGCVPSKALLAAAARAQAMREAAGFGVAAVEPQVDFAAVMDHVRQTIAAIAPHDSQERFERLGVTVLREHGAFSGPQTVRAGETEITARRFVIATGSSPVAPPIPGLNEVSYLTNETVFANRARPDRLIIIGGGAIGIELAQAHQRLGSSVVIVEAGSILNREDAEAVAIIRRRLIEEGVRLHERTEAARVEPAGDGVRLKLQSGETIEGTHLLVAAGRKPNLDGLGLDRAGVEREGGRLKLDRGLKTTNPRVFAAGDAAGGPQFTHLAGDHAASLVRRLLFKTPAARRDALAPRVVFCAPELASIGLSESEAKAAHADTRTIRWSFEENDRARTERDVDGFIKVVVRGNGAILGAAIVGAGAGDEIALWSFAVANRLKISAFTRYIAPYPTRSEISKRAGGAYYAPALFSERTRKLVRLLSIFD